MKAVEIPDDLASLVRASGADLGSFVVEAVQEKLSKRTSNLALNLGEVVRSGWTPPTVNGNAREDGLAWSEIEAPCDPV